MKQIITIFLLIFSQSIFGQNQFCASKEIHTEVMNSNNSYAQKYIQAQTIMQNTNTNSALLSDGIYYIPVVVHVVHTGDPLGSGNNPSDIQIQNYINVLNQAFSATFPSYPDTNSGGQNIKIQFKLAQRDLNCSITNGINRINASSNSIYVNDGVKFNTNDPGISHTDLANMAFWDNTKYLNLWLVNNIYAWVAGYAYYPIAGYWFGDGIVIESSDVYSNNPYLIAHEFGHSFDLRHTFEGSSGSICPSNSNCLIEGDLVCDTDPTTVGISCNPTDINPCTGFQYGNITKNYMNYYCSHTIFTLGQKQRMINALLNLRSTLITSLGAQPPTTPVIPTISIAPTATNICAGTNVIFTATPTNGGTTPSYQWKLNGNNVGTNSPTYSNNTLTNGNTVTCIMTSSLSCVTGSPATSNTITMTVNPIVAASVAIAPTATNVCAGTNVTFTATPTNGGTTPSYQWKLNGVNVGTNSPTYSYNALTNLVPVTCVMTSNAACVTGSPAASNTVTMTVNPIVAASVAIAPTATNICSGTNVIFTATPTNGGIFRSYQWKLNDVNVGTNSPTYSNNALENGNTVSCVMTSNAACVTGSPATSNSVAIVVNPSVAASVAIAPTATNVCAGTNVTFTATPTNGGTTPSYQWKLNGVNVGTNSPTYSNNALTNLVPVTCVMTSNAACVTGSPATSNSVAIVVNPSVAASVAIAPTSTNICAGTNVTFTATPINGGTPSYQWKLNGVNVGTNSPTYSNNALTNLVPVTCVMTSNAACVTGSPATSNSVAIVVNPSVAASVAIAPTSTNICAGTNVTFTATPINGGTPSYQWKLNGNNVGTNSPTYSNNTLTNGNTVTCIMTSSLSCVTGSPATSNTITMTVNPIVAASVAIAPTATNVCAGTNVTFTATPTNGGTTPSYQWKLNGVNVGTNSPTYSYNALTNLVPVTCVMTSNAACVTGSPATSNSVAIVVNPSVAASVAIAPTATNVCAGTNVTFTATPTNGGTTPSYQWKLNDVNVGTNSPTYSYNALTNLVPVTCVMTSNAACVTGSPATSNSVAIVVNPSVAASVAIAPTATNVCAGTNVTFTATPTNGGTTPSYQWKLNGANVGTNSPTYSNNALANLVPVTCVMTSNAACVTGSPANSNSVAIIVNPSVAASVSIAPTATNVCAGTNVTFTATPTNGGAAPSYQWKLNGGNVGTNSATYSNNALANGNTVTCVMTSNADCVTGNPATSNTITMTVNPSVAASVNIAPTATNICAGTNVTFTATPTNGGTTPSYQWKLNGVNVGTNSPTYSNNALTNLVPVTCVMTSNAACVTGSPANSNSVAIIVNPSVAASVSIAPTATNVCAGTNVTFTATPTNGGAAPSYQWKLNGNNVGTNSSTYSNNTLANGNTVSCVMTSNAACVTGSPATSNTITMTVNPSVAASVSIAPTATNVCAGTNVTFTATPINGGAAPNYQWKLNGNNVGTNSSTYSNNTLANGNLVSCVMTSNAACVTGSPATSNTINMTVNTNLTPTVAISANANPICPGTNVTFTATPSNGGTTPSYQWKLNGNNVGTNSATYSNAALATGNTVSCVMTSNASCLTSSTATSNVITMQVTANPPASVTIAPTATNICAGTNVTFTATPINGGTPSYQWKLNGNNVGTNSATYSNNALTNGNTVTCIMTSSLSCVTGSPATSNTITMTVNPNVAASVSIVPTATNVCSGTNVTFTATPTNGGTTPSYQWKLNGANVGTNSPTYSNNALANLVPVTCVMTSNAACVTGSPANSNSVAIIVNPSVAASVSIAPTATNVCAGTNVTFTATPTNGGAAPTYQWKLNGGNVGTNSATYSNNALANGNTVSCVMTSNAACVTGSPATSNTITMTVNPNVAASVSIVPTATNVCSGTNVTFTATPTNGGTTPSYQWKLNGANVGTNSATYSNNGLANLVPVTCVMTSNAACVTGSPANSNSVAIVVNPTVSASVTIAPTATNVCAGTEVSFTATPTNGGTTPSYQWKLNGVNVGTNIATYSNNALVNGNTVSCVMTSNAACVTGSPATSNTINMTVNPNPVPIISQTVNNLNSSAAASYQWNLNGNPIALNGTSQQYTALVNGNYSVTVVDANGCSGTSAVLNVTVSGIFQPVQFQKIEIFPNPNNGLMKMVIETPKGGEITLQIIDILGKLVSEKIVNINQGRNEFALDLSELSQNIYFIKTKLNDLNYQGKIIIAE